MVTGSFSLVGIEDGIGNETIFTTTSTSDKPKQPSSVNTDGYVPDGWYAAPQDVSATYQYQWICKREKKEGSWGAWSEPSLYSNFADGIKYVLNYYGLSSSATIEPTSWSLTPPTMTSTMRYLWNYEIVGLNSGETYETDKTVIGVYGDKGDQGEAGADGVDGSDGVGIDYISEWYLATSQGSGVTTSTRGWTLTVQTMTPTKKYLWNYETITYTDGTRDVGDPKIIGVYGDRGESGQDGTNGTDGKGYEYCYNYTTVNVRPETPTSSVNDNVTPPGWYTYPPSISASRPYIWECQRVKSNGVWSAWSTPTLKNRWAYDGANGDKGAKMRMRTWESGTYYMQGAEGEEFYDIVVYETKLYLCTKTHTSSSYNNPIESIESYLGYWESAQQWTFIATQLLLAGKIVSDKITADLIDADGIVANDVNVSGDITANKFYTPFTYINSLPAIWNPDTMSTNITLYARNDDEQLNYLTLIDPIYAIGLTLRFYSYILSRSDQSQYLKLPANVYFFTEIDYYNTYKLPYDRVTTVTSVLIANNKARWVIHDAVSDNFSNT